MTNTEIIQAIKAEIERRHAEWQALSDKGNISVDGLGAKFEDENILSFLSTLESEKPVPKDLEEAAQESATQYYIDAGYSPFPNVETAAHKSGFIAGAKWQAEQLLKSSPLPEDTVLFNKGVEEGKRLMMEEAYDGEFFYNPYPGIALDDCKDYDFKQREDVRVIVLPKED